MLPSNSLATQRLGGHVIRFNQGESLDSIFTKEGESPPNTEQSTEQSNETSMKVELSDRVCKDEVFCIIWNKLSR